MISTWRAMPATQALTESFGRRLFPSPDEINSSKNASVSGSSASSRAAPQPAPEHRALSPCNAEIGSPFRRVRIKPPADPVVGCDDQPLQHLAGADAIVPRQPGQGACCGVADPVVDPPFAVAV